MQNEWAGDSSSDEIMSLISENTEALNRLLNDDENAEDIDMSDADQIPQGSAVKLVAYIKEPDQQN